MPPIAELAAPTDWRTVDCISDLHLHPADRRTFDTLAAHLRSTDADAIFLLGDVFEVWVGDDAATPDSFEAEALHLLREAASRTAVYVMHGNRDFLLGAAFCTATGATLLADPTVLALGSARWLLSHGDALCLGDTAYLAFRAQVRSDAWQHEFLTRPLAARRAIARGLREQSEAQKSAGVSDVDVDADAARAWLHAAGAATLVHGHTHRPADHLLAPGMRRLVLTDWDCAAVPPRAEVLRLCADGRSKRVPVVVVGA